MKRKDFLRGAGLAGITSLLPFNKSIAAKVLPPGSACTLIPSETEGPFPLDLTENTTYFRKAISETKTGTALNVKIRVIGASNCLPMKNVRVNIWHCDKDGLYSGYSASNNAGQAGLTYCRGYQFTDSDGVAAFTTIFPGWYTGRICHIHFKITVSTSYAAVSQLTFPITTKNALYAAAPTLYTKGADPLTFASDNIFSDGATLQTATLTANTAGGYDTFLEVTVNGTGTTGLGNVEKENAKNFSLGQNFPNPYKDKTTVPFKLLHTSDVSLQIWDLMGRQVYEIKRPNLFAGDHHIEISPSVLDLPNANYVYQLEVKNTNGIYKDVKMMTAAQ